eukprot:3078576-Alexandrium_andersonii.AAC.1
MAEAAVEDESASEGHLADRVESPTTPTESVAAPAQEIGVLHFTVTTDMRVARIVDDANLHAGTLIEVTPSKTEGAFTEEERLEQLA